MPYRAQEQYPESHPLHMLSKSRFFSFYKDKSDTLLAMTDQEKNSVGRIALAIQGLVSHRFKPPFEVDGRYKMPRLAMSSLAKYMIDSMLIDIPVVKQTLTKHEACPAMLVYITYAEAAIGDGSSSINPADGPPKLTVHPEYVRLAFEGEVETIVREYNALAIRMRTALLSSGIRESTKSFRRNATERYRQVMKVCQQAWARHSRILLIRLDWGFKAQIPGYRLHLENQSEFEERARFVDEARKQMLGILRKQFRSSLAFYVWKLECGPEKGLHLHWLIGVNGAHHQDRINVPRQIQMLWDSAVGASKTYTFNVNALYAPDSGLRVLHYSDPLLWDVIGILADYLTKTDLLIKLRLPGRMRAFGCTKLKAQTEVKRGPRRALSARALDVSAVRGPQGSSVTSHEKHKSAGGSHA